MLGKREPEIYGARTLDDINETLVKTFEGRAELSFYQSNCEGDIVTAINGEVISSIDDLNTIKNQYAAGDEVTLTIYRSGAYYEVTVTLVDQATGK